MLKSLLKELDGFDITVIDDGSNFTKRIGVKSDYLTEKSIIRTGHEGKQGFWKKWVMARQICLGSDHDYFLFLPDDFSKVNLEAIKELTKQGWEDNLFAINMLNDKRYSCWGEFSTYTDNFNIGGCEFFEVGFVDCSFLTNRKTLELIDVDQIPEKWFARPDISSGVGYNMTTKMRHFKVPMMMAEPSLVQHGNHYSQMHGDSREDSELSLKFPVYCVSLPERDGKFKRTVREARKLGWDIKKFNAIKRNPGWKGCRLSHLHLMKEINDEIFAIIEDDFLINCEDPIKKLDKAIQELPPNWDMLYLGSTLNEPLERYSDSLYKMKHGWTTHAIIFNNQNGVKDYILNNCPETKIDVYYAGEIQNKFNCFITYPMVATQREGYSDVINRNVDYKVIQERYNKYTR